MTSTRLAPQRRAPEPRFVQLASPRARMRQFLALFTGFACLLCARVVDLQVVHGPQIARTAMDMRLGTVALPAVRGMITDVNGVPIATTVIARNVTVDQTLVSDPAGTAARLAPLLDLPVKTVQQRLTGTRKFNYVAREVTPQTWTQIKELNLPGILSESTTRRAYPAGNLAASIVGYVGSEGHGLGGLEYGMDSTLAGVDGSQTVEWAGGQAIPTSMRNDVEPVNGVNVRLTIDADIQAQAERILAKRIAQTKAEGGDVIVMDPKTGDIVAMATYPTFDPNNALKSSDYAKRNEAVTDAFEPGSTSKIMTMAAVLEEGKASPTTKFTVPSTIKRGGTTFHDHDKHGVLHLTLNGILAKSSNIGTIQASELIGQKKFLGYLNKFGIGQSTGLHFPGESGGLIPKPGTDSWSDTSFPTLAFGQGLSVTALQATSVFATIANDGVRMTPRLVADSASKPGVRVVSATTAATVRQMLESVVSKDGTAPAAQIPGYRVAGKTGTANRFSSKSHGYSGYTASFIGFAPADNPSLVVAVMIHNPRNGHFGSTVSGPVFRQVMMYALAQRKIPPSVSAKRVIAVSW